MKPSEMKPGQLLGVQFPYSLTPEKKFGFKVIGIRQPSWTPHVGVMVRDVKTNEIRTFAFQGMDEDVPGWKLIEDVK